MEDLRAFKDQKIPVPETFFDEYKTKSPASVGAEMRVADHIALSADNKIHPDILKKLNYEEFLDWYEGAYLERLDRLSPEGTAGLAPWLEVPCTEELGRVFKCVT